MAGELQQLRKPELRGFLQASIKRNLGVAIVLAFAGAASYKYLIAEPRKAKYAEFYKTYNAEASFERMRKAGHMSSASP